MSTEAKLKFIPRFQALWANIELSDDGEVISSYFPGSGITGYFPEFPVLIQGNGETWTAGNLYLLRRLAFKPEKYEEDTFASIAKALLKYLRFLESNQLDPLSFHPRLPFKRPTYLFRQHLIAQVEEGNLAPSTASGTINAIINFYKGLVTYQVLEADILDLVHKSKEILLPIISNDGFSKLLSISSSDLAIKKPSASKDPDAITDGGTLFPLTKDQQDCVFEALQDADRGIFLLFLFALMTGARIQTAGTIRVRTLKNARRNADGDYMIDCGFGKEVDAKKGNGYTLVVPALLHRSLLMYVESRTARRRREISYYGDTDKNYVFIANTGNPYYTSKREKNERRDPEHNRRVGVNSASKHFSSTRGDAVRKYISEVLLPHIRAKNPAFPDFSFHDLRATFGMNLLETLLQYIDKKNAEEKSKGGNDFIGSMWALEQVQERMGHADIKTTMQYLNFRRNRQWRAKIISEIEESLMQHAPSNSIKRLGEN